MIRVKRGRVLLTMVDSTGGGKREGGGGEGMERREGKRRK
jgi:hypothetical protein